MHKLQEEIEIQEILAEANAYGLRTEVVVSAEKIWADNKNDADFSLLDAYHAAYHEWIK